MGHTEYEWLETTVKGLGYEFVHLEWVPRNGLARVYIDKAGGVNVDDCARVSEHLSRAMIAESIPYERLEVSSPGLDRPLARARDFERFRGHMARVKLRVPVGGRRTFVGRLDASEADRVALVGVDKTRIVVELANVEKARLVPEA